MLGGDVQIISPAKKLEDLIRLAELCVDLLRQNEEFYAEVTFRSTFFHISMFHCTIFNTASPSEANIRFIFECCKMQRINSCVLQPEQRVFNLDKVHKIKSAQIHFGFKLQVFKLIKLGSIS